MSPTSDGDHIHLSQHPTMIGKVHLTISNQPSHILPQPALFVSSLAFNLKVQCPSQHIIILHPQHMAIRANHIEYSNSPHTL